eukprot:6599789-Prymnesium_polylepis.1
MWAVGGRLTQVCDRRPDGVALGKARADQSRELRGGAARQRRVDAAHNLADEREHVGRVERRLERRELVLRPTAARWRGGAVWQRRCGSGGVAAA